MLSSIINGVVLHFGQPFTFTCKVVKFDNFQPQVYKKGQVVIKVQIGSAKFPL